MYYCKIWNVNLSWCLFLSPIHLFCNKGILEPDIYDKEDGEWSGMEKCPASTSASEFRAKSSKYHGVVAIELKCYNLNGFSNYSW